MTTSAPVAESSVGIPAAVLRPYVRRYVGYRYSGFPPGVHLGLPSAYLSVVISLGAATSVSLGPGRPPTRHVALASGLTTGPALIHHDGHQYGVFVDLSPAGARALLGVPAGGLAATTVDLDVFLGRASGELVDRMASEPAWPGRFAVLDEVLSARVDRSSGLPDRLDRAWRQVLGSGGTLRVADLAESSGWSRRQLTARFGAEYGVSPKDAARIVRFDRSRNLVQARRHPTLAEVAVSCGFYDQAHLAREWRDLAGFAPSAWLARSDLPTVTSL